VNEIWLLDGYNALWREPNWRQEAEQSLDRAREHLIVRLQGAALRRRMRCVLVFDGQGRSTTTVEQGPVEVHFSPSGQSADAYIKRYIDLFPSPACLVVVSDDREIQRYARLSGAQVRSIRDLALLCARTDPLEPEKPPPPAGEELEEWRRLFGIS
jgi:predicted RNA-binding protein with PIN domain